jgi:hypothetical protein
MDQSQSQASGTFSKLSLDQLHDVTDVLRRPLTNREILIPLGRQAFMPGVLQPITDSKGREQVLFRTGDNEKKQISREEALEIIQREIDEQKEKKPVLKSSLKKTVLPSPKQMTQDERYPLPSTHFKLAGDLPYFEIREEYDASGNVHGEAINVTKQLEYLEDQANGDVGALGPSSEEKVARAEDHEYNETIPEDIQPKKKLSDDDFDALSKRLEELTRLEEQAEKEGAKNRKSSKKLQSKGWGKGFLNRTSTPAEITKTIQAPPVSQQLQSSAPGTEQTGRRVAFGTDNQVQEIPRVGHRSVNEIRKPASQTQSFDESVLSNMVRERPKASSSPKPAPPQSAPSRVSRFAQQRQNQAEFVNNLTEPQCSEGYQPYEDHKASKKRASRFTQSR